MTFRHVQNKSNNILICFIPEVRNMKGEEYRGNSLYEIVPSLPGEESRLSCRKQRASREVSS